VGLSLSAASARKKLGSRLRGNDEHGDGEIAASPTYCAFKMA